MNALAHHIEFLSAWVFERSTPESVDEERRTRTNSAIIVDMNGEQEFRAEHVQTMLRSHAEELNSAGILHLDLHGSVARGEATVKSDVDLIADFDHAKRLTLFDLVGLELRLSAILDAPVDLSDRRLLKDEVRYNATRDSVVVF